MGTPLKMKFKAHQSFFIRKGWLSKGLRGVKDNAALLMPSNKKEAMDELGLGANQVVALRYWLQATDLITMGYRNQEHEITQLGKLVLKNDPYIEEIGTLWALHCNLASAQTEAASWYFFFNEFNMTVFDKNDFTHSIERYIFKNNEKQDIALASLDSDFSCILSTYIPHDRTSGRIVSPESVIDCPLGELGLIAVDNKSARTYRKKPANLSVLPGLLVLYAIFRGREASPEIGTEIKLETLLDGPCMPGRMFNLDSVGLLTKLYELEDSGFLRINRTAGLDVVRIADSDMTKEECLSDYYRYIDLGLKL